MHFVIICDVIELKVTTTASIKDQTNQVTVVFKRAGLKAILVFRAPIATDISIGYGSGFLKRNHELPHYFTTLSPFGKPHSESDGCAGSMMPIHINDRVPDREPDDNSATTMLLDGAMKIGEIPDRGG